MIDTRPLLVIRVSESHEVYCAEFPEKLWRVFGGSCHRPTVRTDTDILCARRHGARTLKVVFPDVCTVCRTG